MGRVSWLNRDLSLELREKNYTIFEKKGQATQEEYKYVNRSCKWKIRKE